MAESVGNPAWLARLSTVGELLSNHGGSIKTGPFGTKLKAAEYTRDGVPVISVGEIDYGRIVLRAETPKVNEAVTERMPEFLLKEGDIVFGRKGAVDRSARVRPDQNGWFLGSDGIRLRLSAAVDATFIAYRFQLNSHRSWMLQHAAGSTMPSLNEDIIRRIPLILPSLAEQRAIASVLGALDDKIEQNRRTAQALERLARAIFRAWFVDFEPVKAKAQGATSFPSMPQLVFDDLPTRFVDSAIGPVPQGWEVGVVQDLCDYVSSGGTPQRKMSAFWNNGSIDWFKTGELNDGPLMSSSERITEEGLAKSSCKLWPAGTILFALYASPTVGRLGVLTQPGTSNQAAAGLIAKKLVGVQFLMHSLLQARSELQRIAVGAAQQNINLAVLRAHRLVVPPTLLMDAYSSGLLQSAWDLQVELSRESERLAGTRDYLLPRLLSGQASVRPEVVTR